ncbi:MAG TPA: hypothetical protein VII06_06715 [Chloroflexota bacterium]|jgi:hypothetical protein
MSVVSAIGATYPSAGPAGGAGAALPGALAVAVDTSVLDATLLQETAVYQLLKVGGGQALQVLKGLPPALGQHVDAYA